MQEVGDIHLVMFTLRRRRRNDWGEVGRGGLVQVV